MTVDKKKHPGGRKRLFGHEPLDQRSIRLTASQWAELDRRGGIEWLRASLDGAESAAVAQPVTKLGWIEWIDSSGYGAHPVGPDDAIAYRLSNGEVLHTDHPHRLNWSDWGSGPRIVAYRPLAAEEVTEQVPWIEWAGGACPVDPALTVQILMRDEGRNDVGPAGLERWDHVDERHELYDFDIVAYRVLAA